MKIMDELIELHEEHTSGLLRLCRQAGWPDYGEQELALLVQQGRFFGYQNVRGDIISCIGLFLFGRLASIGLVIVDKEYKRLGLGRRMVNACISKTDESTVFAPQKKVCRFMRKRVFIQRVQSESTAVTVFNRLKSKIILMLN